MLEHDPEVAVITETWLHENILNSEVTPPNYSIIRKDREGRGGGVAIMIKNNIKFEVLEEVRDVEALWIKTKLNNRTVYIGGVYRAPNSPVEMLLKLRGYMDSNLRYGDNILLLGDLNLPGIDWSSYSHGTAEVASCDQLLELVFCYNLSQVVTDYTRVCSTTSTILDLVFVSESLKPYFSKCETEEGLSDHRMVLVSLNVTPEKSHSHSRKMFLDFRSADDVSVLDCLEQSFDDFMFLYQSDASPDTLWDYFSSMTLRCIERFIPKRPKKIANKNPWITREIIHAKRQLKRRRASSHGTGVEKKTCIQRLSRLLRRLVRESKERFYSITLKKFLSEAPEKFWRYVNPSAKFQQRASDPKNEKQSVENFSTFFSSVFTNDDGNLPSFSDSSNNPPINNLDISEQGVFNLLLNIDSKKSPGPDEIPNEFLKRYAEWVSKYLTIIFRLSMSSGSFPSAWKIAKIIPIHKSGSVNDVCNFRPISLTSTCSKLLEHIISKHLLAYLEKYDILFKSQHGFRRGLSTTTQLIETVHDLSQRINCRGQTDVIFLDFAKAFDKVSHPKLLLKISAVFKNPAITKWFSSYLSSRKQYVKVGGSKSTMSPVVSGVPQGSVLGPLLFLIYINDLRNDISVPIRLFADDCVIYNKIETSADQVELNCNLEKIKKWCQNWQMVLNPEKSVFMSITRKINVLAYNYCIAGAELERVKEHKYLGLIFTPDLKWNTHIDNVCIKANKALWCLRRNLAIATPEIKSLAYKTLVRPVIEYSKIVWDPYTVTNCNKLEKIQRLASRFIFNKYSHVHSPTKLCELANLPTFESRTKYERLKFLFQIIHNCVKIRKSEYFEISSTESSRHRHSMYIPNPSVKNDCFKYSFFPRAIKDWNILPDSAVSSMSLNEFLDRVSDIIVCATN